MYPYGRIINKWYVKREAPYIFTYFYSRFHFHNCAALIENLYMLIDVLQIIRLSLLFYFIIFFYLYYVFRCDIKM